MTNFFLYIAWCVLYGVCAALGCIAAPTGWLYALCILCGIAFFLPPAVLLYRASKTGDRKTPAQILVISLIWLAVALIMIVCNILSVAASELAGTILYYLMVVLTVPMVTVQFWVLGIFLWACLMVVSIRLLKKSK